MLLDYVAANEIHLEEVADLVDGAADVCRRAGVALVGGETAELPGIYAPGELDFAGTCVGIVARADLIDGSTVTAGDVVIGFPSAGVHANGFTLVRSVLETEDYDGDDLLAPTRLYLDTARALQGRAKAFVHVTGGGILGNLERVLPAGRARGARLGLVGAAGGLRLARAARGRGRAAARLQPGHRLVRDRRRGGSRRDGDRADRGGGARRGRAGMIGVLVSGNGTNLQALIDAGLPVSAVASNRRDAYALVRAREAGIPVATFSLDCHADRAERDLVLATWLEEHGVELVVLAGYMHLLTRAVPRARSRTASSTCTRRCCRRSRARTRSTTRSPPVSRRRASPSTSSTRARHRRRARAGRACRSSRRETLVERIHAVEHRLLPEVVSELCLAAH